MARYIIHAQHTVDVHTSAPHTNKHGALPGAVGRCLPIEVRVAMPERTRGYLEAGPEA
jgi:hypothetical protein